MNDEQFQDLKQFIDATVSQSEARTRELIQTTVSESESRLRQELASKQDLQSVAQDLNALRHEVRDGFAGTGDAIEALSDHIDERLDARDKVVDEQLADHEHRLSHLEQAA